MLKSPLERRLLAAFGLILLLLAAACGLSILSALRLSDKAEMIFEHPFPVTRAIRGVDADIAKIRLAVMELVEARDKARVEDLAAEIARLDQDLDANISIVRARYLGPPQDVDRLENALERWRPIRAMIIQQRREGRPDLAKEASKESGARHYAEVDRAAGDIFAFAQGKASELIAQSRQATSQAILFSVVLAGAFVLIGGAVSFVVLRSLGRGRERFQAMFEQAAVGMAHLALEGRWRMVNGKLSDILGYTRDEMLDRSFMEFTHPDDRDGVREGMERLRSGEIAVYSAEIRCLGKAVGGPTGGTPDVAAPDGAARGGSGQGEAVVWADLTLSLARDGAGSPEYFICVVQDISARKSVEEELAKARGFIRNILNSMPSVVIGVDPSGNITHLNHMAAGFLPGPADSAVGHPLERFFPQYASDMEAVRMAIRERRPVLLEKQPQSVEGEVRYQDVLIYPLVTNGVEGAVLRIDDVTERVRLTEMMVQTEKMMSVGGLAAGMAHEINNPLGSILQSAQVILSHVDPRLPVNVRTAEECGCSMDAIAAYLEKRKVLSFLQGIREAGARAARIVANMLDFSRSGESSKQPVSLADILDRSLELASTDYDLKKKFDFRHIAIRKDYARDLPPALCSRTEIEQVALNILKNAAHAMAEKQYVQERPVITVRTVRAGAMVSVVIEDNGPGMVESVRKRIFEPFFTTKKPGQGTGLGLSVSYFIVTANHGGSITVESEPGQGTRFIVSLPAAA